MGAPAGHPYAHPEGVCINGLGALPSPYGPTLRGAHNGPSGLQKKKSGLGVPRPWSRLVKLRFNSGQIRCKPSQYLRLYLGLHGATTKWNRANPSWPATSTNPKYETRVRWQKILDKLVLWVVWSKYSDSNIKGHISTKKYLDVRFNTKIGSWSLHSSTKMHNSRFYRQSDLHVRSDKILIIWKEFSQY